MKILIPALTLFLFTFHSLTAQEEPQDVAAKSGQLEGTWTIDLRPSSDADPYLKEFVIALEDDKTFSGEFYGSPIVNGLINSNWEKVYFAFSTSDQSNTYFHSGYVLDGKILGTTYCPNRNFVAPWNGSKK